MPANLPAMLKTLGQAVPPIADVPNEEILVSQRQAGKGRYLFVVNDTTPELEPGQLWRATLSVSTRVPLQVPVGLKAWGGQSMTCSPCAPWFRMRGQRRRICAAPRREFSRCCLRRSIR